MIAAMLGAIVVIFFVAVGWNAYDASKKHVAFTDARHRRDQDQYVAVLDKARWFSNLDRRSTFSFSGATYGHRAFEAQENQHKEELHKAMKKLAAYFQEPDPCPCMHCQLAKIPNADKFEALRGLRRIP